MEDVQNFVLADFGKDEKLFFFDDFLDLLGVPGKSKEVVVLLDPFRRGPVLRAFPVDKILFPVKGLTGFAVQAGVFRWINVSVFMDSPKKLGDRLGMPFFRGANEGVVGNAQLLPDLPELVRHLITVGMWLQSPRLCLPFHIDAVLVVAHQEEYGLSLQPFEPGDDVCGDLLVGGADVWQVVHIVDRGRHVVSLRPCHWDHPLNGSSWCESKGLSGEDEA